MPSPPACVYIGECFLPLLSFLGDYSGRLVCMSLCLWPHSSFYFYCNSPVSSSHFHWYQKNVSQLLGLQLPGPDHSISVSPSYLISCSPQTFPFSVIDLPLKKNLLCFLGFLLKPGLSTSLTSHFLPVLSYEPRPAFI